MKEIYKNSIIHHKHSPLSWQVSQCMNVTFKNLKCIHRSMKETAWTSW